MILSKFFKNHLTIPQATKLFEEVTSQTVPTIVEKTMTTAQLYNAGSPLWAREYTIYRLFCYMRYSTTAKLIKNTNDQSAI